MDRRAGLLVLEAGHLAARSPWWHRLPVQGHEARALLDNRPIKRFRTAIKRNDLSVPVKLALDQQVLKPGMTVFDYGCGRGDDMRLLRAKGFEVEGWDPYWRPDADKREADIVNLGFVLNVIEDPDERDDVLREAFSLVKGCLLVATRAPMKHGFKPYRDGFVTSTDTFQRFWTQQDLKGYLQDQLGVEPRRLGACCYAVCRKGAA